MRPNSIIALAVIATLAGALSVRSQVTAPVAHAAQTWEIQVGGDPAQGLTAIKFYPRALTIAAGDSINFIFPALEAHSVTFDAAQTRLYPGDFVPDSPSRGDLDVTRAYTPLNVDGSSATYDGSQVINSGVQLDPPQQRVPFVVTFTKPGIYRFECAIHGPAMEGDISVVPAGSTLPETPADAKIRASDHLATDLNQTITQRQLFPVKPIEVPGPGGATTHVLSAGAVGATISVNQFLPRDITVKRGDYVIWNQPDIWEFHTVTFLSGAPTPIPISIIPSSSGPTQYILPFSVGAPSGGTTYTGTGIVNSGSLSSGNSFALKIDAPPGTYEYVCLFHADSYNQKGTITVSP